MKIEFSKICIIIVNYNSIKETISLLKQLRKIKGGGEKKVYIVDSHSTENPKEIVEQELGEEEYFIQTEENLGFGACCNIGIRKGLEWGAEYFVVLNPDINVDEEFLMRLLIALQAQKKTGIVCPLTLSEDGKKVQSLGGSFSLWTGRAKRRFYNDKVDILRGDFEYVDFPIGNAVAFKREFFEDAGLFHEKFFLYYEDVEIGLRAKREYWKVVSIPKSKVFHKDKTKERIFDPLINYVSIRNQIWVERLYANIFQYAVFLFISFFGRYPLKIGRALITFHLKCALSIVKGVFSGLFCKGLYDKSYLEFPRNKKSLEDDPLPEMPTVVFSEKKTNRKSLLE